YFYGSFVNICDCPPGFTGVQCETRTDSVPLDLGGECPQLGCSQLCEEREGGHFACGCRKGYSLGADNTSCVLIKMHRILADFTTPDTHVSSDQVTSTHYTAAARRQLDAYLFHYGLPRSKQFHIDSFKPSEKGQVLKFQFYTRTESVSRVQLLLDVLALRGKLFNLNISSDGLHVQAFPELQILGVEHYERRAEPEGGFANLLCRARGSNRTQFRWLKDGRVFNSSLTARNVWHMYIPESTGHSHLSILNINDITIYDKGEFTCEVEDFGDVQNQTVELDVMTSPRLVITPLAASNGEYVNPGIHTETVEDLQPTGKRLFIGSALRSANYTCVISNDVSSSSITVYLFVGRDQQTCDGEKAGGVTWTSAMDGGFDVQNCPANMAGLTSRVCRCVQGQCVWSAPNLARCQTPTFIAAFDKMEELRQGYQGESLAAILSHLLHVLQNNNESMIAGDVTLAARTVLNGVQDAVDIPAIVTDSPDRLQPELILNLLDILLNLALGATPEEKEEQHLLCRSLLTMEMMTELMGWAIPLPRNGSYTGRVLVARLHRSHCQSPPFSLPVFTVLIASLHRSHCQSSPFSLAVSTVLIASLHPSHYQSPPFSLPVSTVLITSLHRSHYQSPPFSLPFFTVLITSLHPSHYQSPPFSLPVSILLITSLHPSHYQSPPFSLPFFTVLITSLHRSHYHSSPFSLPVSTVLITSLHPSHYQSPPFSLPFFTVLITSLHPSHYQSPPFLLPVSTVLLPVSTVLITILHRSHYQSPPFSLPVSTVLITSLHPSHYQSPPFSLPVSTLLRALPVSTVLITILHRSHYQSPPFSLPVSTVLMTSRQSPPFSLPFFTVLITSLHRSHCQSPSLSLPVSTLLVASLHRYHCQSPSFSLPVSVALIATLHHSHCQSPPFSLPVSIVLIASLHRSHCVTLRDVEPDQPGYNNTEDTDDEQNSTAVDSLTPSLQDVLQNSVENEEPYRLLEFIHMDSLQLIPPPPPNGSNRAEWVPLSRLRSFLPVGDYWERDKFRLNLTFHHPHRVPLFDLNETVCFNIVNNRRTLEQQWTSGGCHVLESTINVTRCRCSVPAHVALFIRPHSHLGQFHVDCLIDLDNLRMDTYVKHFFLDETLGMNLLFYYGELCLIDKERGRPGAAVLLMGSVIALNSWSVFHCVRFNFILSLFLVNVLCIVCLQGRHVQVLCLTGRLLLHLFLLGAFSFLFVDVIHVYVLVHAHSARVLGESCWKFLVIGWGIPVLSVGSTACTSSYYGHTDHCYRWCWVAAGRWQFYPFLVPMLVLVLACILISIRSMLTVYWWTDEWRFKSRKKHMFRTGKNGSLLVALLAVTGTGCSTETDGSFSIQIVFIIFLFIMIGAVFIAYCASETRVVQALSAFVRRRSRRRVIRQNFSANSFR
ncbi:hypothetical protein BaRGS_00020299, partial [Batillaria attramentaria]